MKPKIAISMVHGGGAGYGTDSLKITYAQAVARCGGLPVLLPTLPTSVELLIACQGLMLTGGGDFDPALFHQQDRGTDWSGVNAARDETELALINEANRLGVPILGICRGIQALAVAFGGTLVQDIALAVPGSPIRHSAGERRREAAHPVSVVSGTKTAAVLGSIELEVNSFHHQAVDQIPPGWQVSARAPDHVIEAMESSGERFLLGVQWHPEDLTPDEESARRLFQHFVDACRIFGGKNVRDSD